jgi:hypothetical protein
MLIDLVPCVRPLERRADEDRALNRRLEGNQVSCDGCGELKTE